MVSYLDVDIIVLLLCVDGTEYCDEAELPVGHLDRCTHATTFQFPTTLNKPIVQLLG